MFVRWSELNLVWPNAIRNDPSLPEAVAAGSRLLISHIAHLNTFVPFFICFPGWSSMLPIVVTQLSHCGLITFSLNTNLYVKTRDLHVC